MLSVSWKLHAPGRYLVVGSNRMGSSRDDGTMMAAKEQELVMKLPNDVKTQWNFGGSMTAS